VYFHDEAGQLKSLPTAWTDLFPPDPVVIVSAGRSAFRLQDLMTLAGIIKTFQTKGQLK